MAMCFRCLGRGYIECPECDGEGVKWPDSMNHGILADLDRRCGECEGSGKIRCPECDGSGEED